MCLFLLASPLSSYASALLLRVTCENDNLVNAFLCNKRKISASNYFGERGRAICMAAFVEDHE
jgi:hypothetical protein